MNGRDSPPDGRPGRARAGCAAPGGAARAGDARHGAGGGAALCALAPAARADAELAAGLDCGLPGLFVESAAALDVGAYDFLPYCSPALSGDAAARVGDALTLSPGSLAAKDEPPFGAAYGGAIDPAAIFDAPNASAGNAAGRESVFGALGVCVPDALSGASSPFSSAAGEGVFGGREVHRSPHASEQRRRALMNRSYRRLRDMLLHATSRRRSKADLLDDAVNELERLRNADAAHRARLQVLAAAVARAHQQLLAAGLAPAALGADALAAAADVPRGARGTPMRPLAPAPHHMRR